MSLKLLLLLFLAVSSKGDDDDLVCELSACQALDKSSIQIKELADRVEDGKKTSEYLTELERRLRSLEQPGRLISILMIIVMIICYF